MIEAVRDIEENNFWKQIHVLLCALFSSLKVLRLCDTNFPGMDKIYYFIYCANAVAAKSVAVLNDEILFGPIAKDWIEMIMVDYECIGILEL